MSNEPCEAEVIAPTRALPVLANSSARTFASCVALAIKSRLMVSKLSKKYLGSPKVMFSFSARKPWMADRAFCSAARSLVVTVM